MSLASLKSLHAYLRLLENASELKRRMPASSNARSFKEGLSEFGKLASLDPATFKDPENIAQLIGAQRFVMIWGEPSVGAHVGRIFEGSKILVNALIAPTIAEATGSSIPSPSSQPAPGYRQSATPVQTGAWPPTTPGAAEPPRPEQEPAVENLKALLSGKTSLACRLFRVLFEHMLGFGSQASAQQGSASLVNELTGSKEHGRSFLATAMFVLGAEVDRENLMSFMLSQGLFGMQVFEQLLLNRDYCNAYLAFRRLERAFVGTPSAEEAMLSARLERFSARYAAGPRSVLPSEINTQDKTSVDANLAAADLLEALSLTPWSMSLPSAIASNPANAVLSMKVIATQFENHSRGEATREEANQAIADHLLAFAGQFSADEKPIPMA